MSIVVQVNTNLENRLRENASKKGLNVGTYIGQFLEHIFPEKSPSVSTVSGREATLLQQVNLDFTPEKWALYLKLKEKRQKGKLTKLQQEQLIKLTEEIEMANAKRIAVLAELAHIRNLPIRVLMEQLGLTHNHE
jgi:hypothetical protein